MPGETNLWLVPAIANAIQRDDSTSLFIFAENSGEAKRPLARFFMKRQLSRQDFVASFTKVFDWASMRKPKI
jgi:hypothetical protein